MTALQGKGASPGIAIGPLVFAQKAPPPPQKTAAADSAAECVRFETARAEAARQLGQLATDMVDKLGAQNAQLFEIHQMMLDDTVYIDAVKQVIQDENTSAEYAVYQAGQTLSGMFSAMDDEYMRERAADVLDVSRRVLDILMGRHTGLALSEGAAVLAGDDFVPSETAQFDRERVLALLTRAGASNSHTAIFARTMGIPAVIGLGPVLAAQAGSPQVIVDGDSGQVWIDPDEALLTRYREKQARQRAHHAALQALKGQPSHTLDGQSIDIYANIGGVADAALAMENDAGGIGLFRSEFLYLQTSDYPSEEAQYAAYRAVVEKMEGRRVVIRTLDIGADKQIDYFDMDKEENPALGYRAIRICLDRPEVFLTQLRALLRASAHGKLAIMFPMVISLDEVLEIKRYVAEAKRQLNEVGRPYDDTTELGIMIETPAAAVISDMLAPHVDFFSVGTNDLTQYTLAIDRQNAKLDKFCDTHHPAVLRLIKLAADNAHRHGKWIGICGELAADTHLTETFLAMGVDELSISPAAVLPLRETVRSLNLEGRREALLAAFM